MFHVSVFQTGHTPIGVDDRLTFFARPCRSQPEVRSRGRHGSTIWTLISIDTKPRAVYVRLPQLLAPHAKSRKITEGEPQRAGQSRAARRFLTLAQVPCGCPHGKIVRGRIRRRKGMYVAARFASLTARRTTLPSSSWHVWTARKPEVWTTNRRRKSSPIWRNTSGDMLSLALVGRPATLRS